MIRLAMLRHGHTPWNRMGRIQGRSDIALDADARAELQAQSLPADWSAADLVASPLERAWDTAALVADRPATRIDALVEMNWGTWEGLHGCDLKADPTSGFKDIEDWGWDYRPPSGETPAEVWQRLAPWLLGLQRDTIAVCHIGIMRVILARAYGWDFAGPAPFAVKRNRLFVVEIDGTTLTPVPDPIRLIREVAE
ncbi:histidine phosphatase family protein [Epibacterium ulvae]|uniref:histidine phosphatase family protein n=1 Tax=Epibacterium ulvae TaxID=1156985 RepID=UPI001BFC9E6A|nr:histidine phosphatase family protein [Epibacterium ulvae]MBT8153999.1 histidine phosphatase family protein [Epibacterium ulvae]